MDYKAQYQQQQQQMPSQSCQPSQYQASDQSTQAYYAYYNQQQYPYFTQHYTNAYNQQQQSQREPASIRPPGVPIPSEQTTHVVGQEQGFSLTHVQNQQGSYYPPGVAGQQQQQQLEAQVQGSIVGFGPVPDYSGPWPPISQSPYGSAGRRRGKAYRGGGRGHGGPRPDGSGPSTSGRGRGRGRGRHFQANSASVLSGDTKTITQEEAPHIHGAQPQVVMPQTYASSFVQAPWPAPFQGHAASVMPPPPKAWCELCRVDCNTSEILEQHKNGKKHKKNLQVYEELQKHNKTLVEGQTEKIPTEFKPEDSDQSRKVEASDNSQPPQGKFSLQTDGEENRVESRHHEVSVEAETTEQEAGKPNMNHSETRGHGFKRKMRGGRGGKWMRTYKGKRRAVGPSKPKEVIPLICELCNVKCDSPVVFESHLTGKKHLSNLRRFQGQQTMLGQATLQALYPALQALYPALQALCQPNVNASTSFVPQYRQGLHGPEAFLAQPEPSMLPQAQASIPGPVTTPAPRPPSVSETKDVQNFKLPGSTSGGGSQNVCAGKTTSQELSNAVDSEAQQAITIDSKLKDRNSESGRDEVNLSIDNSAVAALGNTSIRAQQSVSATEMGVAAVIPDGETAPSDQVAFSGLDNKTGELELRTKEN